jgi:YesN/AraC family two-component response regulator
MSIRQGPPASTPPILHVMIADDVGETRQSIHMMMSLVPNSEVVAVARNGREAIEMAKKHRPDIALVDINMPEVDGLTAIQKMRQHQPNLICIIISAEKDPPTLQRAIAVGAHGYLIKPISAEQLLSVMERASKMVHQQQAQSQQTVKASHQQIDYLEKLAAEYAKLHRTDDQTLQVFEDLAAEPDCKPRWLMTLAMMYVIRKQWAKLQALAGRMARDAHVTRESRN